MTVFGKLKKTFVVQNPNKALNAPPGVKRPVVYLDIVVDDHPAGRITIELFSDITPKTAENFKSFCTGKQTLEGIHLTYKMATFHRVPGFMIQGGDILRGDGSGHVSIYGPSFPDENFIVGHDVPGLLSMANSGPNTNGCQFFITTAPASFLNGKHTVFGRVIDGMSTVKSIEAIPTVGKDRPSSIVGIIDCGEITTGSHQSTEPVAASAGAENVVTAA